MASLLQSRLELKKKGNLGKVSDIGPSEGCTAGIVDQFRMDHRRGLFFSSKDTIPKLSWVSFSYLANKFLGSRIKWLSNVLSFSSYRKYFLLSALWLASSLGLLIFSVLGGREEGLGRRLHIGRERGGGVWGGGCMWLNVFVAFACFPLESCQQQKLILICNSINWCEDTVIVHWMCIETALNAAFLLTFIFRRLRREGHSTTFTLSAVLFLSTKRNWWALIRSYTLP